MDDGVTLDKDARPSVDNPVSQVLLDILNDGFVFCSRLQPKRGNGKRFGLLKDAKRDLQRRQQPTDKTSEMYSPLQAL